MGAVDTIYNVIKRDGVSGVKTHVNAEIDDSFKCIWRWTYCF